MFSHNYWRKIIALLICPSIWSFRSQPTVRVVLPFTQNAAVVRSFMAGFANQFPLRRDPINDVTTAYNYLTNVVSFVCCHCCSPYKSSTATRSLQALLRH